MFLTGLSYASEALMFTEKGAYRYSDGVWCLLEDDKSLRAWLDAELELCIRETTATSTIKLVGEARAWIIRQPQLQRTNVPFDRTAWCRPAPAWSTRAAARSSSRLPSSSRPGGSNIITTHPRPAHGGCR